MGRTTVAWMAAGAVLVGGGLAGAVALAGGGTAGSPYEAPNYDSSVPHSSLSDWISYGDYVVAGTVISEAEGEHQQHGDGTVSVGRTVTLKVDRTLWAAPGFEALESVEVSDWGWTIKDGRRIANSRQMEVGGRYMLPLARFDEGWGYIALRGYVVNGDSLTTDLANGRSWLTQLSGMSLDTLASELAATEPDPRVASLRHLTAEERVTAVFGGARAFP